MNLQTLRKNWLTGKIEPIYFFYGSEDFLIQRYVDEIRNNVLSREDMDFNFDLFYGSESDGAQIVNAAASFPMMSEKRLVIVKDVHLLTEKSMEIVENYVKNPSQTTCLILIANKAPAKKSVLESIRKASASVEVKQIYDYQIPNWVRNYLKESHLTIAEDALRLLHASTGNSLRVISTEIEKIKLNLGHRSHIEFADVEAIVGTSKQYNIFELCDAVGHKNLKNSLHILNQMMQLGEQPVSILSMLNRHFIILAKVKELKARQIKDQEITRVLKVHPYFLPNYVQQANKFSRQQLSAAFNLLLMADENLKSSYQKPKMVLELLLFKLYTI